MVYTQFLVTVSLLLWIGILLLQHAVFTTRCNDHVPLAPQCITCSHSDKRGVVLPPVVEHGVYRGDEGDQEADSNSVQGRSGHSQAQSRRRIGVMSLFTSQEISKYEVGLNSVRCYCRKHGYRWLPWTDQYSLKNGDDPHNICGVFPLDADVHAREGLSLVQETAENCHIRPGHYVKALALAYLLDTLPPSADDGVDWLVHVDADIIFTTHSIQLEEYIEYAEQNDVHVVAQALPGGCDHVRNELNNGMFLVRNSVIGREFIRTWWRARFHKSNSMDQAAFGRALARGLPYVDSDGVERIYTNECDEKKGLPGFSRKHVSCYFAACIEEVFAVEKEKCRRVLSNGVWVLCFEGFEEGSELRDESGLPPLQLRRTVKKTGAVWRPGVLAFHDKDVRTLEDVRELGLDDSEMVCDGSIDGIDGVLEEWLRTRYTGVLG